MRMREEIERSSEKVGHKTTEDRPLLIRYRSSGSWHLRLRWRLSSSKRSRL